MPPFLAFHLYPLLDVSLIYPYSRKLYPSDAPRRALCYGSHLLCALLQKSRAEFDECGLLGTVRSRLERLRAGAVQLQSRVLRNCGAPTPRCSRRLPRYSEVRCSSDVCVIDDSLVARTSRSGVPACKRPIHAFAFSCRHDGVRSIYPTRMSQTTVTTQNSGRESSLQHRKDKLASKSHSVLEKLQHEAEETGSHAWAAFSSFSWLWPIRGLLYSIYRE